MSRFYAELPVFTEFSEVTRPERFAPLPADWHVAACDVRKFNDVYRQLLAGTAAQRAALTAWLDERYARRELAYGLHVADRAHMTCLVFDYSGRHLHFIDGADGGFFAAAAAFKERVARLARER